MAFLRVARTARSAPRGRVHAIDELPEPLPRTDVVILSVPLTGAVVTAMVLALLLPDDLRLGPRSALPTLEGFLLLALVAGDPDWFSRRSDGLAHCVDRPGERARAQCHLVDRAPRR
ncbi:hypothetical protein AB0E25_27250 [Streptomyces bobili]|uniref:hypothetical protein n=1 Tax=Streptomyces bobili TaxID=67280 RepID=UPI00340A5EE4